MATLISIHAPSRERLYPQLLQKMQQLFQSTLPRGSDKTIQHSSVLSVISIHAPSRERRRFKRGYSGLIYFNPRSLAGATCITPFIKSGGVDFNPRSLAGATSSFCTSSTLRAISIHAPSRERRNIDVAYTYNRAFQSTLPRGSDSISIRLTI